MCVDCLYTYFLPSWDLGGELGKTISLTFQVSSVKNPEFEAKGSGACVAQKFFLEIDLLYLNPRVSHCLYIKLFIKVGLIDLKFVVLLFYHIFVEVRGLVYTFPHMH